MKKLIAFGLVNLLILFGCVAAGMYATVMAGRLFARDVIFVAPFLNESHLHWSEGNVAELQREFGGYSISPVSRGNIIIQTSTGIQTVATTVVYTDAAFFSLSSMRFSNGGRWTDYDNSIVLSQALAWRLFGSNDVIGLPVEINLRSYTVTGVVQQDQNVREYMAWMPRNTMAVPLPATALYIQAHNYNLVDVYTHTRGYRGMLRRQFRNPDNYSIVDINRYVESIGLRGRIFLYILCLYALVMLIGVCLKHMRKKTVLCLALLAIGALAYTLFIGVNDILYWLPNIALSHTSVFSEITNIGALPPVGYLCIGLRRLVELNRMANIAWIIGTVATINLLACKQFLKERSQ